MWDSRTGRLPVGRPTKITHKNLTLRLSTGREPRRVNSSVKCHRGNLGLGNMLLGLGQQSASSSSLAHQGGRQWSCATIRQPDLLWCMASSGEASLARSTDSSSITTANSGRKSKVFRYDVVRSANLRRQGWAHVQSVLDRLVEGVVAVVAEYIYICFVFLRIQEI